jgi:hypothetical protein
MCRPLAPLLDRRADALFFRLLHSHLASRLDYLAETVLSLRLTPKLKARLAAAFVALVSQKLTQGITPLHNLWYALSDRTTTCSARSRPTTQPARPAGGANLGQQALAELGQLELGQVRRSLRRHFRLLSTRPIPHP